MRTAGRSRAMGRKSSGWGGDDDERMEKWKLGIGVEKRVRLPGRVERGTDKRRRRRRDARSTLCLEFGGALGPDAHLQLTQLTPFHSQALVSPPSAHVILIPLRV